MVAIGQVGKEVGPEAELRVNFIATSHSDTRTAPLHYLSQIGTQLWTGDACTVAPGIVEKAQREIETSADRDATRVACDIGECRELAMH